MKRMLSKIWLVLLAAQLVVAEYDRRGTIEGIVTEMNGTSISDAYVQIVRIETKDIIVLRTNDLGKFNASNLPLGTYHVTVEKNGFHSKRMSNIVLKAEGSVLDRHHLLIHQLHPSDSK